MGLFDELRCALIRKRALLHSALCARHAVQKRRRSFEQMGLRSSSNNSALQNGCGISNLGVKLDIKLILESRIDIHCKCLPDENYGDWELRGPCMENLHYLW